MKPFPRAQRSRRAAENIEQRPGRDAEAFDLERFLPYRLSVLTNTISRSIARLYADRFGLTIPEWRVMAVLGRYGALSPGEICARTAMDKVRVSRAVSRLQAADRVHRTEDPDDRRRVVLTLSAAGWRIHDRIVPLARAREAELLAVLSRHDRTVLDDLIGRLWVRARELEAAESDAIAAEPTE
jgi:DNA-binding MarR family transcriptional regulator